MGKITGVGFAVPTCIVKNWQISQTPQWVEDNIGIKERRKCHVTESTLTLATEAGAKAIISAGLKKSDIDMVIVATATPEKIAPSTACLLIENLELDAVGFDINAVCSGFLFGLSIAEHYLDTYRNILVIGVDTFSTITDYNQRDCVFFGDGAGAVVYSQGQNMKSLIIKTDRHENGFKCDVGSKFDMNGHLVYKKAIELVPDIIDEAVFGTCDMKDITYMVPHQPSKRILYDIANKIGLPRERVLMNMDKYGNTSAGTIPILLAENWDKFKKGDLLLFASIGSGWTYGAGIYEV